MADVMKSDAVPVVDTLDDGRFRATFEPLDVSVEADTLEGLWGPLGLAVADAMNALPDDEREAFVAMSFTAVD